MDDERQRVIDESSTDGILPNDDSVFDSQDAKSHDARCRHIGAEADNGTVLRVA